MRKMPAPAFLNPPVTTVEPDYGLRIRVVRHSVDEMLPPIAFVVVQIQQTQQKGL
jgi:hypothetical protein